MCLSSSHTEIVNKVAASKFKDEIDYNSSDESVYDTGKFFYICFQILSCCSLWAADEEDSQKEDEEIEVVPNFGKLYLLHFIPFIGGQSYT